MRVVFRATVVGPLVIDRAVVVGPVIGTRGVVEQFGVVKLLPSLAVHRVANIQQ